jgi:hypothetical protein
MLASDYNCMRIRKIISLSANDVVMSSAPAPPWACGERHAILLADDRRPPKFVLCFELTHKRPGQEVFLREAITVNWLAAP